MLGRLHNSNLWDFKMNYWGIEVKKQNVIKALRYCNKEFGKFKYKKRWFKGKVIFYFSNSDYAIRFKLMGF